jgi:hypothetical protein
MAMSVTGQSVPLALSQSEYQADFDAGHQTSDWYNDS